MKKIGLYVHIPFCKQKCFYCDFPSYAGKEKIMDDYIDALIKEINQKCTNYKIRTLFIGGGTPSYLNLKNLEKLLKCLYSLNYENDAEKTIECNPGTTNREKFKIMKSYGINRLSFGVQSTKDNLLKNLGRIHTYTEFLKNYNMARDNGFLNINIDLMFGLPSQTLKDWKETLEDIVKIKPEHISSYGLIIEENTPFYKLHKEGSLKLPSEENERDMYNLSKSILEDNGYHQYEISNYSLEGKECEHNKIYWKCEEYIGIGVSSSSYIDNKRIINEGSIEKYIESVRMNKDVSKIENVNTVKDNIEEFMFMNLRLIRGIDEREFERRFNEKIDFFYKEVINKNIKIGLLKRCNHSIYLTEEGVELSNLVMSDMIMD